jgi:hypothetical protein
MAPAHPRRALSEPGPARGLRDVAQAPLQIRRELLA